MSTVAIVDCRRQPIHHLSSVYNEALKLWRARTNASEPKLMERYYTKILS